MEKYVSIVHKKREYQFDGKEKMVIKDGCLTASLKHSPWLYEHVKDTCIRREPAEFPLSVFWKIYHCVRYYFREGTTF